MHELIRFQAHVETRHKIQEVMPKGGGQSFRRALLYKNLTRDILGYAEGGSRTPTMLPPLGSEPSASAIPPLRLLYAYLSQLKIAPTGFEPVFLE